MAARSHIEWTDATWQNGEWIDADEWFGAPRASRAEVIREEGGFWKPGRPLDYDDAKWLAEITGHDNVEHQSDGSTLIRVGKRAAGRLLDGKTHSEFPT